MKSMCLTRARVAYGTSSVNFLVHMDAHVLTHIWLSLGRSFWVFPYFLIYHLQFLNDGPRSQATFSRIPIEKSEQSKK